MSNKEKIKRVNNMLQILSVRYDYIMAKDNPYYRIFGTESERLLDANFNIRVQNRLRKYKTNLLCK
jgi:hypothetical protein